MNLEMVAQKEYGKAILLLLNEIINK